MNICYFGFYNSEYSRNRIFLKALKSRNDVNLVEVNSHRDKKRVDDITRGLSRYLVLVRRFFNERPKGGFDRIIVGYSDYFMVPLVKLLAPRTPIINDFFYSQYNSLVNDRKKFQPRSFIAWMLWIMDWISLHLPHKVIVDTDTHGKYYCREFGVDPSKLNTIYVGTDTDIFYPRNVKKESDKFIIHFHGKYIPLQGVMKILEAAKILKDHKDIEFRLVGRGQEYLKARKFAEDNQLQNVIFKDIVPYEELPELISESDVVLGIFGDSEKAKMVIPNKVFEGIACGKPVLTQDSSAIKEFFTDKESIFLVSLKPQSIAELIKKLQVNRETKDLVGQRGYQVFRDNLTVNIFSENLHSILKLL